jgi:hypothetical protein
MAGLGHLESGWQKAARTRALTVSPLSVALFAMAASLALRLPTLSLLPPWGDEVFTLNSIALPPFEMMKERLHRMHSPTYYWILQLLGLDGSSLFLLRLPSALADSAGAALTALVACRLGGWRAGVALALLYAAMPVMLEEAQDARPNGFLFGFLGLLLWSASRLADHPRLAAAAFRKGGRRRLRWTWAAAGFAAFGAVNMLPLGIFAVLATDLAVLWGARRAPGRALLRPWLIQRLVTLLALLPLFYGFLRNVGRYAGHYWYSSSLQRLLDTVSISAGAGVEYDPNRFLGDAGNVALLCLFLLLVALGVLWTRRRASFSVVIALAFGTQVLLIAISQHTSLYVVRYFAIATPALTLLAALGAAGLIRRRGAVGLVATAAAVALLLLQSLDAMHQLGKPRFDLAVAGLRAAGVERLIVHVENKYLPESVMHYLQDVPEGHRLAPWSAYLALGNGRILWVIDNPWARADPTWRVLAERGVLVVCAPQVEGVTILAVARRAQDLRSSCPTDPAVAGAA